jgi:hypothetical protein
LKILGAASYVLTNDKSFSYSDIDFIFRCDLSSESVWTQIKTTVCECLSRHISSTNSSSQLSFSPIIIQAAYVEKVVRVINPSNNDSWALMSLCNVNGQNIELKFVDRMKRQFQFSVDSFQILLDPLLDHYEQQQQQQTNKKSLHHHYSKQQHGKYQLVAKKTKASSCRLLMCFSLSIDFLTYPSKHRNDLLVLLYSDRVRKIEWVEEAQSVE